MKKIRIVDVTLRESAGRTDVAMSFREKLEVAKQMDKLKVDAVELPPLSGSPSDNLLARSIANTLGHSVVSIPAGLTEEETERAWSAVSAAKHPRLHVIAPTSTVRMEYSACMKPDKLAEAVAESVRRCREKCGDVEFSADDATRSDMDFLCRVVKSAIAAGAGTVTLCDSASAMLPQEFGAFVRSVRERVPELDGVVLSVQRGNDLKMAAANSFAAIAEGAQQIKTALSSARSTSIETVTRAINTKGVELGLECSVRSTELHRAISQMHWMATEKSETSPFETGVDMDEHADMRLDATADIKSVAAAAKKLGYELSGDDVSRVYEAFRAVAEKKQHVGAKELEAMIASAAMQVPPRYRLVSYVVNSGNIMGSTSHITIERDGEQIQSVCLGDGPIDAAFLAIEQIIGRHYELDDFQIQAVTEGREAMGDAVVKLRAGGKLFSGRGISTDIIGASIYAYVNAINKIAYEEKNI